MTDRDELFPENTLSYCPLDKLKTMMENSPITDANVKKYVELLDKIREHEVYVRTVRQNFESHLRVYNMKNMINSMNQDSQV